MVAADLRSTAVWVIHSLPGSYQTGTGTFRLTSGLRLSSSKYGSMNSIVSLKLLLGFAFSATVVLPLLKKWLKQHKLILLQFSRSEVWNQSHWANVKVSHGWLLRLWEERPFLCIFQLLVAACVPWQLPPPKVYHSSLYLHHHIASSSDTASSCVS